MLDKVIDLIKGSDVSMPRLLLNNYVKLNIKDRELIILLYLINEESSMYNPSKISADLNIPIKEVLMCINRLSEIGFVEIQIKKVAKIVEEHISLDNLYQKLAFLIVNEDKEPTNIYDAFEKEFGRTLSPIEFEIISYLESNFSEELILLALKEAIFNNAPSLKYVDRILQDWKKKNIKNASDVEKEKVKFKEAKDAQIKPKELFDYDWLNEK
ncbi:MAG: DnaD domain protein [Bacilli bacterium]|nr:DnaD domain protein [Bacilli bacterium]